MKKIVCLLIVLGSTLLAEVIVIEEGLPSGTPPPHPIVITSDDVIAQGTPVEDVSFDEQ